MREQTISNNGFDDGRKIIPFYLSIDSDLLVSARAVSA